MEFQVEAKEYDGPEPSSKDKDEPEQPCIYLNDILPKEQIQKMRVDDEITITLKGKVKSLTISEGEDWGPDSEMRMSVYSGELHEGENEFSEMADE